ncbi:MAG: response regulator [Aquimonas sp.]|nr:response regulator [Aquimonas sp.]
MSRTTQPPRVLLVEDDPVSADFLAQLLRGFGLEVALAMDVDEAKALLASPAGAFTLALVDQNLAGGSGELLLDSPNRPPMLAISAEMSADERERLCTAGFVACLRKPLDGVRLASALRSLGLVPPDFDELRGLEVAAGDPVVLAGLRELLRGDLPQRHFALQSALARHDTAAARAELHTLLGSCRLTGALRLERAVEALIAALQTDDRAQAWDELEAAIHALLLPASVGQG